MQDFWQSFGHASRLILNLDPSLVEIVLLSLRVSITATVLACLIGMPLGALLAVRQFRGKWIITVLLNTFMGMPPVVLGLVFYLLLSTSGPLGWMQLLYTPGAMILVQFFLILPIVTALTKQVIEDAWLEYQPLFQSLSIGRLRSVITMLQDTRSSLLTVLLAGFARAISEVGAVIVVGGNINHLTRVMTTAIALETSKGELAMALALGMILLLIALSVNALVFSARQRSLA